MEYQYIKNREYLYSPKSNFLFNSSLLHFARKHEHRYCMKEEDTILDKKILNEKVMKIPSIAFEITQACNMRCKYCIFGGSYHFQRNHSEKILKFYVARHFLDYFYEIVRNRKSNKLTIGFYGGEPLLNFANIEKIVKYSRSKFKNFELSFTISTNGTLLYQKKIQDFLIDNNFYLRISLDGPENIHDKKRKFSDDLGSYHLVRKNLQIIKDHNAEFFKQNVSIGAVHSPDLPLKNVINFFSTDKLVSPLRVDWSSVSSKDTDLLPVNLKSNERALEKEEIFHDIKLKMTNQEKLSWIEKSFISPVLDLDSQLNRFIFSNKSGTCLFDAKLFVDTEGKFHICEKMNNQFPIGNIESGFDYSAMLEIFEKFVNLVKMNCSSCDYRHLCQICYADVAQNKSFNINEDFCRNKQKSIKQWLNKYIELKEENLL